LANSGGVVSNEDAVNAEKRLRVGAHSESDKRITARGAPQEEAPLAAGGMQIEDRFDLHRFNAQANGWVPNILKIRCYS
jgi:hypothetical protein